MAITLTWGGVNINDGTIYSLGSFDFGRAVAAYDEVPDLSGLTNKQVNAHRGGLVLMTLMLKVEGTTAATRDTYIDALDDLCAGTASMVYNDGGTQLTFTTLVSDGLAYDRQSYEFTNLFRAWVTLSILREA